MPLYPRAGFGYNDGQMKPAIHVQIIRTIWTKRSRGAPAATARARVPLWLPVAVAALRRGELTVVTYDFGEPDFTQPSDFKIEARELTNDLRFEQGAFSLRWNGKSAQTDWHWNYWNVGAPEPHFPTRDLGRFEIAPDSWVRLHWQGRTLCYDEGHWQYQKTVVNVARCDADLNVDFSGEPARSFEWLPQIR